MSERRVLVIRGGAIGDFVLTLPAIRLIQDSIEGAHIAVMGNHGIVELAQVSGHAHEVRHLDSPALAKMFARNPALDEELCAWLRSFNLVVSYLFDPDGYFRSNMERAGVRTFLDAPHRVQDAGPHAQFQLSKPLEKLAMWLEPDAAPVIHVPEFAPRAENLTIAVHPGSGSLKKNWPVEHWCRVGQALTSAFPGAHLVLVTGEAERERGVVDAILPCWNGLPYQHWDALPLTELARRFPACTHFLGHDSGITHLAAACGLRCHALFGPTNPAVWAPRNVNVSVYQAPGGDLGGLSFEDGFETLRQALETGT